MIDQWNQAETGKGSCPIIRNFTPHEVTIMRSDSLEEHVIARFPSEGAARAAEVRKQRGIIQVPDRDKFAVGVPVYEVKMGDVTGLPEPKSATYLIVSRIVAEAAGPRSDLIIPDETVRDTAGRIIGCRTFAQLGGKR